MPPRHSHGVNLEASQQLRPLTSAPYFTHPTRSEFRGSETRLPLFACAQFDHPRPLRPVSSSPLGFIERFASCHRPNLYFTTPRRPRLTISRICSDTTCIQASNNTFPVLVSGQAECLQRNVIRSTLRIGWITVMCDRISSRRTVGGLPLGCTLTQLGLYMPNRPHDFVWCKLPLGEQGSSVEFVTMQLGSLLASAGTAQYASHEFSSPLHVPVNNQQSEGPAAKGVPLLVLLVCSLQFADRDMLSLRRLKD